MAEITNELMYELLKHIQEDVAALKEGQREHSAALNAYSNPYGWDATGYSESLRSVHT